MLFKVNAMVAKKDGTIRSTSRAIDAKDEATARAQAEKYFSALSEPYKITSIKAF